ncbi:MAG: DUF3786 domain-containing protein [Blautia sp.]|jgi:hypothetical protein
MTVSNYEIMRNQMRGEFSKYDQKKMIQKYSLKSDEEYLYIDFVLRHYRINRRNGVVEWSKDHFETIMEADYNESMTIYDVLCDSKDNCSLSGKYCSVNMLKGVVQSAAVGVGLFQKAADDFNGKKKELEYACGILGEKMNIKGDVAAKLYPFSFLPIILQYWEADDEFPANLKFMFDENILDYMHYETIFFMTGHIVNRIKEIMVENDSQSPL